MCPSAHPPRVGPRHTSHTRRDPVVPALQSNVPRPDTGRTVDSRCEYSHSHIDTGQRMLTCLVYLPEGHDARQINDVAFHAVQPLDHNKNLVPWSMCTWPTLRNRIPQHTLQVVCICIGACCSKPS